MPAKGQCRPLAERFLEKVDASGDCWEWTASLSVDGYGRFQLATRKPAIAHRVAWEMLVGPIPEGMQLDHLCRNRRCVNPDHLEVVTHSENARRGFSPIARNRHRTVCKHGHPLSGTNLRVLKCGKRECIRCRRQISFNARQRQKAKAA